MDNLLSHREREVLELMAAGYQFKHFLNKIGIAYNTVKVHVASIYQKLDVTNSASAVARAAHLGEIDLEYIDSIRAKRDLSKDDV